MDFLLLTGFALYCIIIISILFIAHRYANRVRTRTGEISPDMMHFALGGRSTHYVVTALSAHASDMSDWLFMAYPAAIYSLGMGQMWIAVALVCGMLFSWYFVAPRLRVLTEEHNVVTLSGYFEKRCHDRSGAVRLITAAITIFFFVIYIAAGLKGVGFLLDSCFGIPYHYGTAIAAGLIAMYTAIGGFGSIAWLDCFQALFLLCVLVFVPIYAFFSTSGIGSIVHAAMAQAVPLNPFPRSLSECITIFMIFMAWMPGYCAMPHILTKFMGTRRATDLRKSARIGIVWQITVLTAATFVGLIGLSFFTISLSNHELIFIEMVKALFYPPLAGLMLCAILAATLSTMDSQLLVIATTLSCDIYPSFSRKALLSQRLVLLSRLSVCIIAFLSWCAAYHKDSTIQLLVSYCWTGISCSFGPLVLLSLYKKDLGAHSAVATILAGGLMGILWTLWTPFFLKTFGYSIPSTIPGFVAGFLASLLFTDRKRQVLGSR